MIGLMRELNRTRNQTLLIVTHDPGVGAACDRIITMQDGEVVSDGQGDVVTAVESVITEPVGDRGADDDRLRPQHVHRRAGLARRGGRHSALHRLALSAQPGAGQDRLRNIPRRPTQSILIVLGLTLSTVIIVSSLAVGDTLSYSIRRQAVDAYGATDEILAPPLISLFASLASGDGSSQETSEAQAELERLTEGGLTSVLAVLEGGLPSISEARFRRLQTEAQAEPLIDGVAGSIVFPTIIRDVSSGQGEPLGFIFAVDDDYDQQFGLVSVTGTPLEMEALEPGVGNIFKQASNLFNIAGDLTARVSGGNVNISNVALATAAVGAALTGGLDSVAAAHGGGIDLAALSIDTATLRDLGIDTTVLDDAGIDTLSLDALGLTPETLEQMGVTTTTVNLQNLAATTGIDTGQLQGIGNDLLGALNLNTLGRELERAVGPGRAATAPGRHLPQPAGRRTAQRARGRRGRNLHRPHPHSLPHQGHRGAGRADGRAHARGDDAAGRGPEAALHARPGQRHPRLQPRRRDGRHSAHPSREQQAAHLGHGRHGPGGDRRHSTPARRQRGDRGRSAQRGRRVRRRVRRAGLHAGLHREHDAVGRLRSAGARAARRWNSRRSRRSSRAALASQAVRDWLLNLDIPADATSELRDAYPANEFDIIDPLSKANIVTVAGVGGTVFTSIFSLFASSRFWPRCCHLPSSSSCWRPSGAARWAWPGPSACAEVTWCRCS
ncbi:MAG: hypothetical protein R3A10_20505 [Caldilineaceae bacterium]